MEFPRAVYFCGKLSSFQIITCIMTKSPELLSALKDNPAV